MRPEDFEDPTYDRDDDTVLRRMPESDPEAGNEELIAELDRYTYGYRVIRTSDGEYGIYQVAIDGDRVLVESAEPVDMTALSLTGLARLVRGCREALDVWALDENGAIVPMDTVVGDEKTHGGG